MKLSKKTISILKNFSSINNGIVIEPGNVLRTISITKGVMGIAEIDETFPEQMRIYDLNVFLSTLSLFDNPQLDCHENFVIIHDGNRKVKYYYAEESLIVTPTRNSIELPDSNISLYLREEDLVDIQRASSILRLPDLVISGDNECVTVTLTDSKNESENTYEIELDEGMFSVDVPEFKAEFKMEMMKVLMMDYDVAISMEGISEWKNEKERIRYYIAGNVH